MYNYSLAEQPMSEPPSLFIGHSSEVFCRCLAEHMQHDGYQTSIAQDGSCLLEAIADNIIEHNVVMEPDLIICEIDLPCRRGVELLADVRSLGWNTPFILLATDENQPLIDIANRFQGIYIFINRYSIDDLRTAVALLSNWRGIQKEGGESDMTLHGQKEKGGKNRRVAKRVPLEIWVEDRNEIDSYMIQRGVNISTNGLYFKHHWPYAHNSLIDLQFVIPGETTLINVKGRVVRVRRDGQMFGAGVEFLNLTRRNRERINSFVMS